jgi:hypothetical protein
MFGRHVVAGRVIAKNGYGPPPAEKPAALTKQNAVFYQGPGAEMIQPPADTGEWILRVEGVDQHGKPCTQNKYVDELEFNTTEIGDPWPSTSKA